jgi:hypothetical protein
VPLHWKGRSGAEAGCRPSGDGAVDVTLASRMRTSR